MTLLFGLDTASVLLTVVITILAGWLFYFLGTRHRRLGELTCYVEQDTSLYESLLNKFDDLEIRYKKKTTTDHFYFYDVILQNTGSKDFAVTDGGVNVTVPLSDEIVAWDIVKASDRVQPSLQCTGEELKMSWQLLRCGEFVRFQLVARASKPVDSDHKGRAMLFLHRIPETRNVRQESSIRAAEKRLRRPIIVLMPVSVLLIGAIFIMWMLFFAPSNYTPAVRNVGTGQLHKKIVREDGSEYFESTDGIEVTVGSQPPEGFEPASILLDTRIMIWMLIGELILVVAVFGPEQFKMRRRVKQLKGALND